MPAMRKVLLSIVAAALVAGCQHDKKDPAWSRAPAEQGGVAPQGGTPARGDTDARLAKLEKRLDKITAFLRQAVPPELDTTQTYAVPIEPGDAIIGAKDAKVTIVEAYEFLCPYCAMMAPTMEQLLEAYPNDVRIVPKYMLIHGAPAAPSGLAICAAAKQGKASEMQKALWQKIWPQGPQSAARDQATAEAIAAYAAPLGINGEQLKADMAGPECQAWLQQSGRTLQKFGVGGTPSFFINGKVVKAGDLASFKAVVDAELKIANASGLSAADYYQKAILDKGKKEAVMISPFDE